MTWYHIIWYRMTWCILSFPHSKMRKCSSRKFMGWQSFQVRGQEACVKLANIATWSHLAPPSGEGFDDLISCGGLFLFRNMFAFVFIFMFRLHYFLMRVGAVESLVPICWCRRRQRETPVFWKLQKQMGEYQSRKNERNMLHPSHSHPRDHDSSLILGRGDSNLHLFGNAPSMNHPSKTRL